ALAAFTVCEPGVLNALGFCVYEVLDNVLLHSELGYGGYAMAQIHPNAKHIALCIYDTGQGIFNSLRDSHAPKSSISAIETAIKKDVTSGKGAGFGLWGLHQIVDSNSGRLSIASGSGMLVVSRGTESKFNSFSFLSRERNCTLVDFQIDFDKRIDFGTALGGYEPLDFFIENVEDDDGNAVFSVKNECPGTGTRPDGVVARNRAMNYEKLAEARVLIDFAQVEHISASFADEFIAKMVSDLGVDAFRERFSLLNRSSFVADLIDRATAKRVQPPNQAS
ncbi:MAG: ATP-binding protein, partial [Planctomycetaceae bacterium]